MSRSHHNGHAVENTPVMSAPDGLTPRIATIRGSIRTEEGSCRALLTVRDVAGLLQVPVSWVYDHVRADAREPLPVIRIGKYLRFRESDLNRFLDSLR